MADAVRMVELRVLEGPNLYFTRPAIKLTLAVPGWLGVSEERLLTIAGKLGVPFEVDGFWSAVLGGLVISVVSWLLNVLLPD